MCIRCNVKSNPWTSWCVFIEVGLLQNRLLSCMSCMHSCLLLKETNAWIIYHAWKEKPFELFFLINSFESSENFFFDWNEQRKRNCKKSPQWKILMVIKHTASLILFGWLWCCRKWRNEFCSKHQRSCEWKKGSLTLL